MFQAQTSCPLKFNPWETAITFRPARRSLSKTVDTQYNPSCQKGSTLVRTPLEPENSVLSKQYAFLSCAKICVDDSRFSPDLHKDRRVTLNKKQESETSDSTAYITETHQTLWSLLTNTIPHGRTIMYMVSPATEASMMAVGPFSKHIRSWEERNGPHLIDDSVTRLKSELAEKDPNAFFLTRPIFSDDDTKRPAEVCSLETFLLQDMDVNDMVIIIADTRHTRMCSERMINPTLCKGDVAFFCNCPTTLENLRLWAPRAYSWRSAKCERPGNRRVCGRSRCDR